MSRDIPESETILTLSRRPSNDECRNPSNDVSEKIGEQETSVEAHRNDPLLATAAHARPIVVPQFSAALLVRTGDLPRHMALLQERFHPFHLSQKARASGEDDRVRTRSAYARSSGTHRLNEVPGTLRIREDWRRERVRILDRRRPGTLWRRTARRYAACGGEGGHREPTG